MGQNALSQSDCRIFKSTFLPEEIDEAALFFANSQKLKHDQKSFYWTWSKEGVVNLDLESKIDCI